MNTTHALNRLVYPSLLSALLFAGSASADNLVPPAGYYAAIEKRSETKADTCAPTPAPYTDKLVFRSKYEGSGKARATLNKDSEKAFRDATANITTLEKGISKQVMQYMRDGRPEDLQCTMQWLSSWAEADALLSTEYNHTGKSIRKWALGSMASAYLRLKFSESKPLAAYPQQSQVIEAWFNKLADQTVQDWSRLPLLKINNHSYWAAWSVMATAVATNRRDLFDWSVEQFRIGANQVDTEGYLPNELKRQQRALAYHNYALPPLAMIASFAKANHVDLTQENREALRRLAERVLTGVEDEDEFNAKAAQDQDMDDLQIDSKYAWLEPYCTLYRCSTQTLEWKQSMQPFKTFRLGGDLTKVYDPAHDKGKGS
ncbi:MAG: mannuronate-specific alginate lyase [Pseudomonas sp.]|uniref:mannuronate-specific alginate lyase n=1 Tax=Pseudomonas sp. TaxID=306 RepID=UPI0027368953|nr:mannuronate-specific alginate lyase [Pseudomonas sp.]MDP3846837.1 mannuronate-specific alginate lyase [Pseudomonas sp.]